MIINSREDLACRTQVRDVGRKALTVYQGAERQETEVNTDDPYLILIEPLRNMPLVKDLVVDMEPFLGKVEDVQPWLQPAGPDPERERPVDPKDWVEAAPYINCILCGCCHSVCPAAEKDDNYLGPAALAAQYRFLGDPRDTADESRMNRVDSKSGVWGCDMVWNCGKVCPKEVPPTKGIAKTRARIRRAQRDKR
jgi:succinate dehydrogenase / fumarate reductase iron-sulfur subunit